MLEETQMHAEQLKVEMERKHRSTKLKGCSLISSFFVVVACQHLKSKNEASVTKDKLTIKLFPVYFIIPYLLKSIRAQKQEFLNLTEN